MCREIGNSANYRGYCIIKVPITKWYVEKVEKKIKSESNFYGWQNI